MIMALKLILIFMKNIMYVPIPTEINIYSIAARQEKGGVNKSPADGGGRCQFFD